MSPHSSSAVIQVLKIPRYPQLTREYIIYTPFLSFTVAAELKVLACLKRAHDLDL